MRVEEPRGSRLGRRVRLGSGLATLGYLYVGLGAIYMESGGVGGWRCINRYGGLLGPFVCRYRGESHVFMGC